MLPAFVWFHLTYLSILLKTTFIHQFEDVAQFVEEEILDKLFFLFYSTVCFWKKAEGGSEPEPNL